MNLDDIIIDLSAKEKAARVDKLRAERDALRAEVADLKKRLGYPRFAR